MNEQQIRQIVKEEINRNYRSGFPSVPPHQHNAIDNLQISEKDILSNTRFSFGLAGSANSPVSADYITVDLIPNIKSISFYGFAFNVTDSQKATINGRAELGLSYRKDSIGQLGVRESFLQTFNTLLIDADAILTAVNVTEMYNSFRVQIGTVLAAVMVPGSSTDYLVKLEVDSFTNTSVTFKSTVQTGWVYSGNLLVT